MLEKPSKQRAVLIGGLVIGAVSGIPLVNLINCCCCAGILAGGVLTVFLYREDFVEGMPPMESSDAVMLGLLGGLVGAGVSTVIKTMTHLIFGPFESELIKQIVQKIVEKMQEQGNMPSGAYDKMIEELDQEMRKGVTLYGVLKDLLFSVILLPIFGMLGGLLGYSIFRRRNVSQTTPHS